MKMKTAEGEGHGTTRGGDRRSGSRRAHRRDLPGPRGCGGPGRREQAGRSVPTESHRAQRAIDGDPATLGTRGAHPRGCGRRRDDDAGDAHCRAGRRGDADRCGPADRGAERGAEPDLGGVRRPGPPRGGAARALSSYAAARVERGVTVVDVSPTVTGATVVLRDASGRVRTLAAGHVVGADGARSAVRAALGIDMVGEDGLMEGFRIEFRAPVWDVVGEPSTPAVRDHGARRRRSAPPRWAG